MRSTTIFLMFVIVTTAIPPDGIQAQSKTRFLRWSYQDAGSLFRPANGHTLYYAAGSVAGLAALLALDTTVRHEVREGYGGVFGGYLDATNRLGDRTIALPGAGIFVASLFTRNTRFQDAAFTALQSLIYSEIIVYAIKKAVGRHRPEENDGHLDFSPFSRHVSFPSGHTAAVLSVLTSWARYYPHPVVWGVVAVASGGTALARIAKDKHWLTDVTAGGTIGFLVATTLARKHRQIALSNTIENEISIIPSIGPGGFQFTVRF